MKLYHLTPNGYGQEWFVVESSIEKAKEAFLKSLESEPEHFELEIHFLKTGERKYDWKFEIKEYGIGEVHKSEIA